MSWEKTLLREAVDIRLQTTALESTRANSREASRCDNVPQDTEHSLIAAIRNESCETAEYSAPS